MTIPPLGAVDFSKPFRKFFVVHRGLCARCWKSPQGSSLYLQFMTLYPGVVGPILSIHIFWFERYRSLNLQTLVVACKFLIWTSHSAFAKKIFCCCLMKLTQICFLFFLLKGPFWVYLPAQSFRAVASWVLCSRFLKS